MTLGLGVLLFCIGGVAFLMVALAVSKRRERRGSDAG